MNTNSWFVWSLLASSIFLGLCWCTSLRSRSAPSLRRAPISLIQNGLNNLACNSTIVNSTGTVTSPGFPNNYPNNLDCWIQLTTLRFSAHILLTFGHLALEHSTGCTFDFVEIFDGNSSGADILGKFCSTKPDHVIQSSTSQILIHFHSDHLLSNRGFQIEFSSSTKDELEKPSTKPRIVQRGLCPTTGENLAGTITSPNYPQRYLPNSNCTTVLEAPEGYHFLLNFEEVDIEYDEMCLFDYIEVRDGPATDSPLITQICGRKNWERALMSTSSEIFIRFISDEFVELRGFKVHYRAVPLNDEDAINEEEEDEDEGVDEDPESADWLEEQEPPMNVSNSVEIVVEPQNATVPLGYPHTINCFTNATDSAVLWLKDRSFVGGVENEDENLQVLPNSSLVIFRMSPYMEGMYTCVLLSNYGMKSFNAWITLDLSSANALNDIPETESDCDIEFHKRPKDTTVFEGQNAFFSCYTSDNANVTWLKDDEPVDTISTGIQLILDVLFIKGTRFNDSGIYTCLATDQRSGCTKTTEAELVVVHRENINDVCGKPRVKKRQRHLRTGRVVAGHNAEKGSFPWQAMLWEIWTGSFCGGSLLNQRWVVTAAHCFTEFQQRYFKTLRAENVLVKLGKHDQSRTETEEQVVSANRIIIHPDFNASTYDNDIALVRLSEYVYFTDHVLPVCLTDSEFLRCKLYNDTSTVGTVTGWGMVRERGTAPVFLQEVKLPMVSQKTCQDSTAYVVTGNMFCAGYTQSGMGDACHGDSGSPFTAQLHGRTYLLGTVSWGEGCSRENKFGVFSKVGNYVPWMQSIIDE